MKAEMQKTEYRIQRPEDDVVFYSDFFILSSVFTFSILTPDF
ncbi:MAG: hypothetical protein ACYC4Q_06710 [Victivallaceae bacterium]